MVQTEEDFDEHGAPLRVVYAEPSDWKAGVVLLFLLALAIAFASFVK